MKKNIFILFIISLIVSCSPSNEEVLRLKIAQAKLDSLGFVYSNKFADTYPSNTIISETLSPELQKIREEIKKVEKEIRDLK